MIVRSNTAKGGFPSMKSSSRHGPALFALLVAVALAAVAAFAGTASASAKRTTSDLYFLQIR